MAKLAEKLQTNNNIRALRADDVEQDIEARAAAIQPVNDFLIVKTADDWIDEALGQDPQKMLFGPLWFSNELNVLVGSSNVGKTILAMQIGIAIANGKGALGMDNEAGAQKVLYCDFELTAVQLALRFSDENRKKKKTIGANFFRVEMNSDAEVPEGISPELYTAMCIERAAKERGATVIIVDNISYLKSDTEKARDVVPFMQHLNKIKKRDKLSILIVAHTPKRSGYEPMTLNDIAGSAAVGRFIDSSVGIAQSQTDEGLRYIKQLKERNTFKHYGSDNVIICDLSKDEHGVLGFSYQATESEHKHLRRQTAEDHENRDAEVFEAYQDKQSLREVGAMFGISRQTVKRIVDKMKSEKS